ncbi:hypothetical protein QJS10_CPB18g00512 [Acorus calamus]|uniref:Uncharacterized protein n=1 Tax=Acorus calamus TaxID=4465 RepID=A0AAV9CNP1_ACOCL|nr:hypothetical protein QJS10_CPB18g00512 [Acorus calamus]
MKPKSSLLSPGFRSAAALAGWDEEALLLASLVVEDTPERDPKQKRRWTPHFKTPPTNSRRKRRNQRQSPSPIKSVVLRLDEDETPVRDVRTSEKKSETVVIEKTVFPCMDRLREELSCALLQAMLETRSHQMWETMPEMQAIDKLLFPEEVKAKKASTDSQNILSEEVCESDSARTNSISYVRHLTRSSRALHNETDTQTRPSRERRPRPSQLEDAALALRLQREEFMQSFREENERRPRNSIDSARANLRAMASRAIQLRSRGRSPHLI